MGRPVDRVELGRVSLQKIDRPSVGPYLIRAKKKLNLDQVEQAGSSRVSKF